MFKKFRVNDASYVVYEIDVDCYDCAIEEAGEIVFENSSLRKCKEDAYNRSRFYDYEYYVFEKEDDDLIFICRFYDGKVSY